MSSKALPEDFRRWKPFGSLMGMKPVFGELMRSAEELDNRQDEGLWRQGQGSGLSIDRRGTLAIVCERWVTASAGVCQSGMPPFTGPDAKSSQHRRTLRVTSG